MAPHRDQPPVRGQLPARAAPVRDLGRLISRILCALFALVGAIPLLAGFLVRSAPVQQWAARETARLLHDELGVEASYQVSLELLPFRLTIRDLTIPGSDGRGPALTAEEIQVTPRVFSLLAGQLDVGDIEIDRPRVRLVFHEGKLDNVAYKLRARSAEPTKMERTPFASLAMTEAELDMRFDNYRLSSKSVDVDVLAEPGRAFEVALRLADGTVTQNRPSEKTTKPSIDEDAVCRMDLRLSQRPGQLTIRRLSLLGVADHDSKAGTRPSCQAASDEKNPYRVAARLSSVRVTLADGRPPNLSGHVMVRVPAALANRFIEEPKFEGWLGFTGEVSHDGQSRLPQVSGRIRAEALKVDDVLAADGLEADLQVSADVVRVPHLTMNYADADVRISGVRIDPFKTGAPISAEKVDTKGMTFPGLMRDLHVTKNTIVQWNLDSAVVTKVKGMLSPFSLDAEIKAETSDFEVTHGAFHDANRSHMIGVDQASVRGRIRVDLEAFRLLNTRADFGSSHVLVRLVSIGFDNEMRLVVPPQGTEINLKDISPLVKIPMAGVAHIDAEMTGRAPNVVITGSTTVDGFEFGGFALGDILKSSYRFVPLQLDLSNVLAKKGSSPYRATSAHLDFESQAAVKVDALVESQSLDVRDFLAMWGFDEDPRWTHLKGHGQSKARVHYVLGGPEDRCDGGNLRVVGTSTFDRFEAWEERYDTGSAQFDMHWSDFAASYRGVSVDVPTFQLAKGAGTLAGSFHMRPGAKLDGKLVGTEIPVSKIDALGERVAAVHGEVTTVVGEMSGTLDAVKMAASASMSQVRLGDHVLPPSEFTVRLEPKVRVEETLGTTRCGQPIAAPFDRARWDRDEVQGTFYVSGQLFGGQARFQDLELSSQRAKVWRGSTQFDDFNLAALLELFAPGAQPDFRGTLSGKVDIAAYPLADPAGSEFVLTVDEFRAKQAGLEAKLVSPGSEIRLANRQLDLAGVALSVTTPGGQSGVFDVRGQLQDLGRAPQVDAELRLRTTNLSAFASLIPNAERAEGRVNATFNVKGALARPNVKGGLSIADGEVELKGLKTPISDLNVEVQVDPSQVRVTKGTARIGNGQLRLTGRAPIQGTSLGTARADLEIEGLALSLEDGVRVSLNSKLRAVYQPSEGDVRSLPRVDGEVTVTSFDYTRPMSMTADLSTLAKRGKRTQVDSYDPDEDVVEFDVQLRSLGPLHIENELLDTDLVVDSSGLRLKGTNQRFGMLGRLKLKPGGQILLRNHEFEIRQGWVRFDDLSQIEPQVDVTAVTDYRRFEDSSPQEAPGTGAVSSGTVASSSMGGQWRINLHAYGDPENLKIDLTSTPNLPQDDIFLLLTVGLTRAELDANRSAAVGSSVALEALGTLSGADRAVKDAVPVIDNASMGSAYNPKSGRTEPTITIGKRLAEKIRAQVTTGLSDSSKVESTLRWQMNPQVSVEGSYGNVNDISRSSLGNIGADVRWRLEFD